MATKPISVLITLASSVAYPGFVKCLRRGQKGKFRIIGTAPDKDAVGFAFVDKGYLVPLPESKNFVTRLLEVCRKEKVKVLLPSAPKELISIASNLKKFEKIGTAVPLSSLESLILTTDKCQFFNFCQKISVPTPKFIKVSNYKELKEAILDLVTLKIKFVLSR